MQEDHPKRARYVKLLNKGVLLNLILSIKN